MDEIKIGRDAKRHPNLHGGFLIPRRGIQLPEERENVLVPDWAIQFFSCNPEDIHKIPDALRKQYRINSMDADVRSKCSPNNKFGICVWLSTTLPGSLEDQARERAMDALDIHKTGSFFNIFINESYIRREADKVWSGYPKQLNEDGWPDLNGPTHFTGFSVNFHSPDKITTRILGYDERPWPDANFVYTITDTFNSSGGEIKVTSSEDLDVDTTILNLLFSVFIERNPPLGFVFLAESIYITYKDFDTPGVGGVGSVLMNQIPREIMIPDKKKVIVYYFDKELGGVEVSEAGLFLGGWTGTVLREPSIKVGGHRGVTIHEIRQSVQIQYVVYPVDLRPDWQITWSVDNSVVLNNTYNGAKKPSEWITFNCEEARVGSPVTRKLKVKVIDADGLEATHESDVKIYVRPPEDDDDLPPICKIRPWLPQCNPDEPE